MGCGAHRVGQAGRQSCDPQLRCHFRPHLQPHRAELHGARRRLHGAPARRGHRHHGTLEAQLCGARNCDERIRLNGARRKPALSFARRNQSRWFSRHSLVLQASGAADLARLRCDVYRRRIVALRPTTARRCTQARSGQGCRAGARGVSVVMRNRIERAQVASSPVRTLRNPPPQAAWCFVLVWLALMVVQSAVAVQPDEILKDPALESRARALSRELRCMVCQNQSIDDSDAPLARDLRLLVRERLTSGDSDSQVVDFLVARYGEFVLLKPRFAAHTALLWFGPPALLCGGALALFLAGRRRSRRGPDEQVKPEGGDLTPAEQARLTELLKPET